MLGRLTARTRRTLGAALIAAFLVAGCGAVLAAVIPGGAPRPGISNFGRAIHPQGRLTELGYFITGSALTPDGRFLWTVGAGRIHNDIQITRTADGKVIQTIDDPSQALEGGIAISHDGRSAFVSDTHDSVGVRTYSIDPRTGRAAAEATIPLPPPSGTLPPDDFPPRSPSSGGQSYAAGMALAPDDHTLVVAENLDDHAAVIDTATHAVTQVAIRSDGKPGDRALPHGVAIIDHTAYIADEGDGTVASFDVANPGGGVTRVTPSVSDPLSIDPTKTHPYQIAAAPDGKSLFVSESNADRVLQLDPANLATPLRTIDVRRAEGLGTTPLGLAISPDARTLFVTDANEGVARVVALTSRDVTRPDGSSFHVDPGQEIARIPTGIYPDRVSVSPSGGRVYVVSSQGTGPGPTDNVNQNADNDSVSHRLLGVLQTFTLPLDDAAADTQLVADGAGGPQEPVPVDSPAAPPPGTPLTGPGGTGPSQQIKYVFYAVAENKTYDTMLGDLTCDAAHPLQAGSAPVGNGNPCLVVFGQSRLEPHKRDGSACPQSRFVSRDPNIRNPGQRMDGTPITPNQHDLARQFVTLDNLYADSTTSDDGHLLTASGYASDYELRGTEANNGPSPRPFDLIYPQAGPPLGYMFDALARAGVSFYNYGEAVNGTEIPDANLTPDEQAIRNDVQAHSTYVAPYPSSAAIDIDALPPNERVDDSAPPTGTVYDPSKEVSRMQYFQTRFNSEVSSCAATPGDPSVCQVPQFNELILPNNHTAGTTPGRRTPDALVRDNDLAIGQLVDLVSHSAIWPYSAIFVIQDDSQDGADHVAANRISGFVASPYTRHQAVVSTHYDQLSVIHTMEMILGIQPVYLYDALATPLYDAFTSTPDTAPFNHQDISQALLNETNSANAPMAAQSAAQTWSADQVDPNLVNSIQWAYRYGTPAACPASVGPDANSPCQLFKPTAGSAGGGTPPGRTANP